ncbi:hypothetical protein GCM10017620_01970 [Brevundimonas intermedia]|uniref:Uncharacterized protein n=1 Tax=Brevundimonas intermedia TaxID=74315 RepID=A0ABQ5T3A6_9CAUL|nr:hypothetical protein GCM10017620_01970 [Brevundimonas intermedia]
MGVVLIFLLPLREKVGPKGSDEGLLAARGRMKGSCINRPLIRLASRATFSRKGRRKKSGAVVKSPSTPGFAGGPPPHSQEANGEETRSLTAARPVRAAGAAGCRRCAGLR